MPDSPLSGHRFGNFGAVIDYDADRAVLGVRGEIDLLTASTLGDLVDVLIDRGERHVVLDLADLSFMDASGLHVIADASARLALTAGSLTIRSAPVATLKLLRITGLDEVVRIEARTPPAVPLGPEQHADDDSLAVDGGAAGLAGDLARVGAAPAADEVIDAALALVTSLASATVTGADGVSVILQRHGRLTTVASSNETVQRMDDHQYETGEGPCLAAAAEGHWFHIESLAEERRWPAFIPRAIEEGISSVLSTPLMTAGRPLGALNIYSNTERAFGPRQQEIAALFASQASSILVNAGTDRTEEELERRITTALATREIIAQAQGVLMAHQAITADKASAVLRWSARSANITVATLAAKIVDSTQKAGPDA